jgi:hypothetical protein
MENRIKAYIQNIVILVIMWGLLACSRELTLAEAKDAAQKRITRSLPVFGLKEDQLSELTLIPKGKDSWYFVRFYKARPDQIAVGAWVFANGQVEVHGEASPGAR